MTTVSDVMQFLGEFAPLALAESWDNVGLLIGDPAHTVTKILICLTVTPDVVEEAIGQECHLIVSHHPVLFRPVQRLVATDAQGKMLLQLIGANISLYSPHTAFDSATLGINRQLADRFGLLNRQPLRTKPSATTNNEVQEPPGAGRYGDLLQPCNLGELCEIVKDKLAVRHLQVVGDPSIRIHRLGIACGAAAEFVTDALEAGCQALLTGEARFHDCLRARDSGIALILPGHYATERPAVETLAEILQRQFAEVRVFASHHESDPITMI